MKKEKPSKELQEQALKMAKATQKPGQTKEQTKLISQGIEKGIAEYKKQQKKKSRDFEKAKKQAQKQKSNLTQSCADNQDEAPRKSILPWLLLAISWVMFLVYMLLN